MRRSATQKAATTMSELLFHMIPGAPDPVAPFSHAVEADGWVFVTGQMPFTESSNESPYPESIEAQTHQVMKNLAAILNEAGLDFSAVVKTTIFLTDMSLFATVNGIYAEYFTGDHPARETVAVKGLPKAVNVEISMIAAD